MNKTNIDYLDYTWNPIAMRCAPVSEGCDNCWHLRMCERHAANWKLPFDIREAKGGGKPVLVEKELDAPLRKRKPAKIGVQFMGDLFHKSVKGTWLSEIYRIIATCEQHRFLLLTKRPEVYARRINCFYDKLPNLYVGVSVENGSCQWRITELEKIPAATRFVSFEPLLEEMVVQTRGIDWAIIGCESGPKRRPCRLEWVKSIVEQCQAASVPVWVKQLSINGKVSHDMREWPKELRIRERPK